MEVHEAQLFDKMLDFILETARPDLSKKLEEIKKIEAFNVHVQRWDKQIPEVESSDTRGHYTPKNPPISMETE